MNNAYEAVACAECGAQTTKINPICSLCLADAGLFTAAAAVTVPDLSARATPLNDQVCIAADRAARTPVSVGSIGADSDFCVWLMRQKINVEDKVAVVDIVDRWASSRAVNDRIAFSRGFKAASGSAQPANIDPHWLDSPQSALGGKTAREGYAANPEYAGIATQAATVTGAQAGASDAERDVLAERQRQIEREGWTPAHDDAYSHDQLPRAAAAYAFPELTAVKGLQVWPWANSWFKPRDARRNYVRAGALILAEIERLDRAARASTTQTLPPNPN